MRRTLLLLFLLVVAAPLGAARAQMSGLSFLRLGTNAAALALGDAHVAHSHDAFATYWNPAGLAAPGRNSVALSHHRWIADVRTYAAAARFRAGERGGVGVFVTGTGSGDLEAREQPGPSDGVFSAQFVAAGASYGRRFGPVRVGLTAKYLSERIYSHSAGGYAFDGGLQADLAGGLVQLGAAVQNLGRMNALRTTVTPLPRTVRVGGAFYPLRVFARDDRARLLNTFATLEVSHVFPNDEADTGGDDDAGGQTQVHAGVAAEVMDLVMLRAGLITNDTVRRFSLGGGLTYGSFVVDYAFLPFEEGFGGPGHVLTLIYQW